MTRQEWEDAEHFFAEQESKIAIQTARDDLEPQSRVTMLQLLDIAEQFCRMMKERSSGGRKA